MQTLDRDNHKDFVSNNSVAIIKFWADWCSPCRMIGPIIEEISNETSTPFGDLHVVDFPDIAEQYDVRSFPQILVFENGSEVKRIEGGMPKHMFVKELDQWI